MEASSSLWKGIHAHNPETLLNICIRDKDNLCLDFCFCLAVSLSRQEDRALAAGLLSCANHLYLHVLPDHYVGRAKDNGKQAAGQPEAHPDTLQLCHGLSLSLHVL